MMIDMVPINHHSSTRPASCNIRPRQRRLASQDFKRFAAAWATLPVNRLPEAVTNARSPSPIRRQPASVEAFFLVSNGLDLDATCCSTNSRSWACIRSNVVLPPAPGAVVPSSRASVRSAAPCGGFGCGGGCCAVMPVTCEERWAAHTACARAALSSSAAPLSALTSELEEAGAVVARPVFAEAFTLPFGAAFGATFGALEAGDFLAAGGSAVVDWAAGLPKSVSCGMAAGCERSRKHQKNKPDGTMPGEAGELVSP